MSRGKVEPGDLVVIRNMDVVRNILQLGSEGDGVLNGILVEREFEDPDDSASDVWVLLVNSRLHRMLRWEFVRREETLDG